MYILIDKGPASSDSGHSIVSSVHSVVSPFYTIIHFFIFIFFHNSSFGDDLGPFSLLEVSTISITYLTSTIDEEMKYNFSNLSLQEDLVPFIFIVLSFSETLINNKSGIT